MLNLVKAFSQKFFITDKCDVLNCLNGGTCQIEKGKALCHCLERYSGERCEKGNYHSINMRKVFFYLSRR